MDTRAPTTRRNGATSRRGGRQVTLPPPTPAPDVRPLPLPDERNGTRREVLPGVIHILRWLDDTAQARWSPTSGRGPSRRPGCATPASRPGTS